MSEKIIESIAMTASTWWVEKLIIQHTIKSPQKIAKTECLGLSVSMLFYNYTKPSEIIIQKFHEKLAKKLREELRRGESLIVLWTNLESISDILKEITDQIIPPFGKCWFPCNLFMKIENMRIFAGKINS